MYNRLLLSILALCGLAASLDAQTVLFNCDFEQGIPSSFSTFDKDGFEPSRGMKKYGFGVGVAWVGYTENADTDTPNGTAYSGSWYKEANRSDDWLVTPAIEITDPQAILSWRAHAIDASNPDGYSVYVSDKGNNPEDFGDTPLFTVDKENSTWTSHAVSLRQWAGKNVYIAFVNNSNNCNLLAIDDISVFYFDHSFVYVSETPEAISSPGSVPVKGAVTPSGFLPIEGFKAVLTYNGETYTQDYSDVTVPVGDTCHFDFSKSIPLALDETADYSMTVSSGDNDVLLMESSVTCFTRNVVIEEGTGTWCIYCPRGQYGMELLRDKYPGLIDIAVHINDIYTVADYAPYTVKFFANGIPHCVMDRNSAYVGDPYFDAEERYLKAAAEGPIAKLSCTASLSDDDKVTINTVSEFGKPIDSGMYNIAFSIIEDSLTGVPQRNAYAGTSDDLGGFNKLTDPIINYVYANIARGIFPSYSGDADAFAQATAQRTPIATTRQYDLPATVVNKDNLKVAAMIIEAETGKVVNAAECRIVKSSGVTSQLVDTGNSILISGDNSGNINVVSSDNDIMSVSVYALDGRCISHLSATGNSCAVNVGTAQSFYIVKVNTAKGVVTKKVSM